MHLGYVICKIICGDALYPEKYNHDDSNFSKPPSTYCLKSSLFNALANKDLVIEDIVDDKNDLILHALDVAHVILRGLSKAQFGYFNDGEPVEHVWLYGEHHRALLAQRLLEKLFENHIQYTAIKLFVARTKYDIDTPQFVTNSRTALQTHVPTRYISQHTFNEHKRTKEPR